jgi:hypothetical protein
MPLVKTPQLGKIQKYVCEKNNMDPGNYSYYANQIENDFIRII